MFLKSIWILKKSQGTFAKYLMMCLGLTSALRGPRKWNDKRTNKMQK